MGMQKKDLLDDIQKKIDICNEHLSQNPYPPAQKRVKYVLNNKCRARDIPFYLNAVYNEQQLKIKTDVEQRKKYLYSVEETFPLSQVDIRDIILKITDITTTYKQRLVEETKSSYLGLKKETKRDWVDVISGVASVSNDDGEVIYEKDLLWKEETKNNIEIHCSSLQEAQREYNSKVTKTAINNRITYEPIDERYRKKVFHKYEIGGEADIKEFVNAKIDKIISQELKKAEISRQEGQLYNWEFFSWEFYFDGKLYQMQSIDPDEQVESTWTSPLTNFEYKNSKAPYGREIYVPIKDIISKLNQTKSDTSGLNKIFNQNDKIHKLIDDFDKLYFDPYYEAYSEYRKKYGASKQTTDKRTKAFKEVKKLLDRMFKVILEYDNQISLNSSLADYIVRYNNFNKIYNQNQNRPTIIASKDTQSGKKLTALMKERQQILNSGNAKLKEYYDKQEAQYQDDIANHILQMQKDMEQINKKEAQFTSILDSQNLRYNGLQTAFKDQLRFILEQNQKQAALLAAQYQQNLFQQSDIQLKVVVKFVPDGVPFRFYFQTLDKNFIYEELENEIKEIVNGQNEKKQKEAYLNTTGKEEYDANLIKLKNLEQQKVEAETYVNQLKSTKVYQDLQQLRNYRDNYPDRYTKEQYARLNNGIYEFEEHLQPLLAEINDAENKLNQINQEYWSVSQKCYYYESQMTPQIQASSKKYDVYTQREDLRQQLELITSQMQQIEAIRKNQSILNQNIMITNQNYIAKRSECATYIEYVNHLQTLRRQGGSIEQIEQYQTLVRDWYDHNNYKLVQLDQYQRDLQKQQEDYLNNNNFLKSTKDFKTRQQDLIKEIQELDKQIDLLESPQVGQRIGVTDQGIAYEQGYDFSPNGLYKNLYIDIQQNNEWLDIRKQLEDLYTYYNTYLPSGQIKEPKTTAEQREVPLIDDNGNVTFFEDNKEDCKCNWFLPMDYEIFGPGTELKIKLTTKVWKRDIKGQKIPVLDDNGQATGEFETERRQMAVQNGNGYIFTGQRITLMYTGLPGPESISVFISGVGLEYGALLAGGYVAITPYNIYLLKKYPYQNTDPNGQFFWLQTGALKDGYEALKGKVPIEVTFKIYKKFPLNCGYPKKCGHLTNEQFAVNGMCGLKDFFEKTYDITTDFDQDSFDITKYIQQVESNVIQATEGKVAPVVRKATSNLLHNISDKTRFVDTVVDKAYKVYRKNTGQVGERAAKFMQTKRNIAEWGNSSYSLACNTWNVADAMSDIKATKKDAEQKTQQIIDKMKGELIDLIPPECQDSICETLREVKQDSIKDLGMSVNQNTNTSVETLGNFIQKSWDKTIDSLADSTSKVADGVSNLAQTLTGGVKNFFTQFDFFSLTQYCPRRLSDVTKDINPLKQQPTQLPDGTWDVPESPDVFRQMGIIMGQEIIGNVMEALNNCATRSITNHNINYSNFFPEGTRKYLEAANEIGDIANMAKGMGGYNISLENLFHEANRSSILANFANVDVDDISLGYLYDFLDERAISEVVDTDDWLNSTQTISNLQNTLGKAFAGNLQKIQKLKNGQILSMNDQYKDIVNDNLMQKTQQWADRWSDKVNVVTTVGQNTKGLLDTDFSKAWKNPNQVMNKLNNIASTMNNMFLKAQLEQKKKQNEMNQAFSQSEELKDMKAFIVQRYEYLEKLTKQNYQDQKEKAEKLPSNI